MTDPALDFLLRGIAGLSRGHHGQVGDPPDPARHGLQLRELAARHGLAGWLECWLPEDYPEMPTIRSIAGLAGLRSMEACAALIDLHVALEAAGIPHLQFKGPSTALRFHGDVRKRPFMDLDLFVPADRLRKATDIVETIGFDLDQRLRKEHLERVNAKHLSHVRGAIRLEIHRRLADYPGLNAPFERFWNGREYFQLSGHDIPCLGRADALYHASVHGTGHAFLSLKWLADLALMGSNPADVEGAMRLSQQSGLGAAFLCGHALLADAGGSISEPVRARLRTRSRRLNRLVSRSRDVISRSSGEPRLWIHRVWMLRPVDRLRAILDLGLTPGSRDWDVAPWLPPGTPLVFQAIRVVRLTGRLLGQAARQALRVLPSPRRSIPE